MSFLFNFFLTPSVFKDNQEPMLLMAYFETTQSGVFADVGANDPQTSVSQIFEDRGWSGLIFEPLPDLAAKLRAVRKNPVIEAACTSLENAKKKNAKFYLAGAGGQQSSLDQQAQDALSRTDAVLDVRLTTLDNELENHHIQRLDFLAIDVEGHELEVLAGINLKTSKPKLVLLEDWARDFSRHRWMRLQHYKLVRRTGFNSWYVPQEDAFPISLLGRLQLLRKYVLGMPGRRLRFWRHERKRLATASIKT